MKKRVLFLAVVMALAFVAVAAAAGPTQYVTYDIIFRAPTDKFEFAIQKADFAGDLIADTADCCMPGDLWRVDVAPKQPANAANKVTGIGSGETYVWSGAAQSHPFVRGGVVVSYEKGVNVFPAEMCVRFQYTKAPGILVTPPEGVSEGCWWMNGDSAIQAAQAGSNRQ